MTLYHRRAPHRRRGLTVALVLTAATLLATPGTPAMAGPSPTGTVDFRDTRQTIDGFGFSEAFQRSDIMHGARGLSETKQREILDLLYDTEAGAGFSILRLGIGSSADGVYDHMQSIAPVGPASPDEPLEYHWDGDDHGQVWLAQQAQSYGVERFYANAWSAPGYMKTNGTDAGGGVLCGMSGTDCPSGDWRQAYADYLTQFIRFYQQEGIEITDLGFLNEPDWHVSYASMDATPEQAADMAAILGPTLTRAGLDTDIICCESLGWDGASRYAAAIEAHPGAREAVDTISAHAYSVDADQPAATDKPTWMSEWGPNSRGWPGNWDDGTDSDGLSLAVRVHDTLAEAGASAYLYWYGASIGNTGALIRMDGDSYEVSHRLWAIGAFSRFIRPDAVRVEAGSDNPDLKVSAYRNADGSKVLEIINTGTTASTETFRLDPSGAGHRATTYLTDATHQIEEVDAGSVRGRNLTVELAPRSVTTVVLERGAGHAG
ncbi:glycoside hydrolase family 30 protein [Allostreptomyces psammosilenae]|uniref:Glucosylceramidase n=1 Tax=Allostreptomyces psammosilenae TaxID=1892865 RepID=A0A852ZZZ0_9ACTN|nr:glycoside hydrolase [Allostreptomyces psammosilenae]NYI04141.1 glucosylceramidase [Allostreptomyces psammosilenae]